MTAKPKRFYFQWRNASYLRAIVGRWIAGEPITREEVAYLIEVGFAWLVILVFIASTIWFVAH